MAKKKYTTKVLDKYKKILVAELKRGLNKPGSDLEKSIVGRKLKGRDGFGIYMNEYGINVNYGRNPGKMPGKPPMLNLRDWIERKGIKPQKTSSKKPLTIRDLTFIIGRSIKENGIKPVRFIDGVIDRFEPSITKELTEAYQKQIQEEIHEATPSAKKS